MPASSQVSTKRDRLGKQEWLTAGDHHMAAVKRFDRCDDVGD